LKVTDRIKDVIKSGGEWISSIDMENAILAHPAVSDAAVIGVPHPKWQERPVALVVAKPGSGVTAEEVLDVLAGSFARWQLPERILLVEEIAKTSVGKTDKKSLRAEYADAYGGSGP
ncbi:MAG: AMP-binding enzyme, partial [Acidimicrobiales bacterium]